MTPGLRRFALTAHVAFSVGWIGAVAGFVALSIAGLTSHDSQIVRASYLAMDMMGRFVIVPLSLIALATGLIQALGTQWGLMQHYWVLTKLLLTVAATAALLLHQFTAVAAAARHASVAGADTVPSVELNRLGVQLLADASLATVVLLAVTTLSVYKPWGRTRYGRRKQQEQLRAQIGSIARSNDETIEVDIDSIGGRPHLGRRIAIAVIGAIVVAFVVLHLAGGGLGRHGF